MTNYKKIKLLKEYQNKDNIAYIYEGMLSHYTLKDIVHDFNDYMIIFDNFNKTMHKIKIHYTTNNYYIVINNNRYYNNDIIKTNF